MNQYTWGLISGILAMGATSAIYNYKDPLAHLGEVSSALVGQLTTTEPCKVVQVYKKELKKELKLPKDVQNDSTQKLVAAIDIREDGRDHTVSGVYNTATGAVALYDRPHALPLLGIIDIKTLFVAYGVKDTGTVMRFGGGYDLLQSGPVRGGVVAHVDSDGKYFGGFNVHISWR